MTIYIHIPFCISKCNYCDYYSIIANKEAIKKYINSLQTELIKVASKYRNKEITSIFIGGGTPTSIDADHIVEILNKIKSNFNLSQNCEISIEANPASNINFSKLKETGINRISFGVQSLNDEELRFLGRIHNANLAKETIKEAKKYFNNINVDLIFSLPIQTISSLENTLEQVLELDVQHISAYSLVFEEGTKLYNLLKNNQIKAKDNDEDAFFYNYIANKLKTAGFVHYEVSNFAKSGFECKHNLIYWEHKEYLGIGAAAYSFVDGRRFHNIKDVEKYCYLVDSGFSPIKQTEALSKENIYMEKIFLGLRSSGIDFSILSPQQQKFCETIVDKELAIIQILSNNMKILKLNSNGYFICDEITLKLLEMNS
ncbi:MAG: radical SAM family heme chaperone HemW [Ignavibacteria bacterium]|jgi:oxygen-independent coproporphyrinogen-3 oxidase|nr:radical SAM family heme chaperone HemW [Ignavibacteria bacterium]